MRTRSLVVALFATLAHRPVRLWHHRHAGPWRASRSASSRTSARSTTRTSTSTRGRAPRTAPPRSAARPQVRRERQVSADIAKNIQTFVDQKYDIIVTVGFAAGADTIKAAKANPTSSSSASTRRLCVDRDGRPRPDLRRARATRPSCCRTTRASAGMSSSPAISPASWPPRSARPGTSPPSAAPTSVPAVAELHRSATTTAPSRSTRTSRSSSQYVSPAPDKAAFNDPAGGKAFAQQMLSAEPRHRRHLPGRRPDRQRRPPGRLRGRTSTASASTSTSTSSTPDTAQVHRRQRREEAQEERLGRDRARSRRARTRAAPSSSTSRPTTSACRPSTTSRA